MLPSSSTMRIRVFELEWELLSNRPPQGPRGVTEVATLYTLSIQIQIMRIWLTSPGLLLITKGHLEEVISLPAYLLLYCYSTKWNSGTHVYCSKPRGKIALQQSGRGAQECKR